MTPIWCKKLDMAIKMSPIGDKNEDGHKNEISAFFSFSWIRHG